MAFKIGDKVRVSQPQYPSYNWGVGQIEDIEEREYGGITVKFENGKYGFLFFDEIVAVPQAAREG